MFFKGGIALFAVPQAIRFLLDPNGVNRIFNGLSLQLWAATGEPALLGCIQSAVLCWWKFIINNRVQDNKKTCLSKRPHKRATVFLKLSFILHLGFVLTFNVLAHSLDSSYLTYVKVCESWVIVGSLTCSVALIFISRTLREMSSDEEGFVKARPELVKTVATWMRATIVCAVLLALHTFLYFYVFIKSMYNPAVWLTMQCGRRLLEVLLGSFIL